MALLRLLPVAALGIALHRACPREVLETISLGGERGLHDGLPELGQGRSARDAIKVGGAQFIVSTLADHVAFPVGLSDGTIPRTLVWSQRGSLRVVTDVTMWPHRDGDHKHRCVAQAHARLRFGRWAGARGRAIASAASPPVSAQSSVSSLTTSLACPRALASYVARGAGLTRVTRFGGDDFTMVNNDSQEAEKLRAYQRDRDMLRRAVKIDDAIRGITDDDRKMIINRS